MGTNLRCRGKMCVMTSNVVRAELEIMRETKEAARFHSTGESQEEVIKKALCMKLDFSSVWEAKHWTGRCLVSLRD